MSFKQVTLVGVALLLLVSCSGDDEADDATTTTASEGGTITTLAAAGGETGTTAPDSTVTTSTTTTTTEAPELSFPQYRIVSRESGENGDIVVVLLDPSTYESLSDIDIHNVMSDLVEQFAPVYEAHIVETQAAVDALFEENPTEEQQTELANNYIARLEEGFRIVYVGRFEESGVAILGS
ncbi:MAG: hypothetical protein QNJ77_12125 [Acidimicrobiia bacterium]|nr:hypothetical protein [Acidimicrobiia bacterium]